MTGKTPMTQTAASRIQSTQAKGGNPTGKGSFPARAQAGAANNVNNANKTAGGAPKAPATTEAGTTPKAPARGKPSKK